MFAGHSQKKKISGKMIFDSHWETVSIQFFFGGELGIQQPRKRSKSHLPSGNFNIASENGPFIVDLLIKK